MRLIDADELKKLILAERDKIPRKVPCAIYELVAEKENLHGNAMRGGIRIALRCMEYTPTIEAEPVRHGRWIDRDGKTWCSLCDMSNKAYKPPYCPHCGAKMDGGGVEK